MWFTLKYSSQLLTVTKKKLK